MKSDSTTTIEELKSEIRRFVADRQWEKYHAPKNLSMALAVEAAELMEHFQWLTAGESAALSGKQRTEVREEIADVVTYAMELCNVMGIDLSTAMREKFRKNEAKYPVEKTS